MPGNAGQGWQAAPTKVRRAGTTRRCGLAEQGQKVQRERTSGGRSVNAKPRKPGGYRAGMQRTEPEPFGPGFDSEAVCLWR